MRAWILYVVALLLISALDDEPAQPVTSWLLDHSEEQAR